MWGRTLSPLPPTDRSVRPTSGVEAIRLLFLEVACAILLFFSFCS